MRVPGTRSRPATKGWASALATWGLIPDLIWHLQRLCQSLSLSAKCSLPFPHGLSHNRHLFVVQRVPRVPSLVLVQSLRPGRSAGLGRGLRLSRGLPADTEVIPRKPREATQNPGEPGRLLQIPGASEESGKDSGKPRWVGLPALASCIPFTRIPASLPWADLLSHDAPGWWAAPCEPTWGSDGWKPKLWGSRDP